MLQSRIGIEENNLAVKPFIALLGELMRGNISRDQVIAAVDEMIGGKITDEEKLELDAITVSIEKAETEVQKMAIIWAISDAMTLAEYRRTPLKNAYDVKSMSAIAEATATRITKV